MVNNATYITTLIAVIVMAISLSALVTKQLGDRITDVAGHVGHLENRMDRQFEMLETKMETRFDKVEQRFEKVDERFEKVDQRFEKVDQRFDILEGALTDVAGRLTRLERDLGQR